MRATATHAWRGGSQIWRWGGAIDADTCGRIDTLQIVVPEIDDDAGGGLTLGETKDYEVTLEPGEYEYSCPLNPTPDYRIVVAD